VTFDLEAMMISIAEAILQGAHRLRKADVPEARREAGSLLGHIMERDRSFIIAHAGDPITPAQMEEFAAFVEQRAEGKPLQYITGHQEFFGLDFEVSADVLIPRPETELLVESALKLLADSEAESSICDVGTGSGCVVVSLLHERPNARGTAIDISPAAIEVARRNAAKHEVSDRIEFLVSDCFAEVAKEALFDLIVSNPPYIRADDIESLQREVRDYEPHLALEAGSDGLAIIRRLLAGAAMHLKPGGHFLFEIGFDQREAVESLIAPMVSSRSWKLLDIYQDLQGIPRTVVLQKAL
jgi:release factor glutamine methyltransferase